MISCFPLPLLLVWLCVLQVERVKNNTSLTDEQRSLLVHEKRETIVKPLIHTIERLTDITGKTAETRHEQWFQETYSHLIEKGLHKLNNPVKDEDLVSDWQPFKQVSLSCQYIDQILNLSIWKYLILCFFFALALITNDGYFVWVQTLIFCFADNKKMEIIENSCRFISKCFLLFHQYSAAFYLFCIEVT